MGPVVGFFGGDDQASRDEAVAWVRSNGWTRDDVAITVDAGDVIVYARRRLW